MAGRRVSMSVLACLVLIGGSRAGAEVGEVAQGAAEARFAHSIALLFDEAHHNVHRASDHYRGLVELLEASGVDLHVNHERFSPEVLDEFDVLLVPVARSAGREVSMERRFERAFSDQEVEAVFDWVRSGGGLLLFTDHKPSAGAVRVLTDRLGVESSDAFTADPAQARPDDERNWARHGFHLVFSREDDSLAGHAISSGRSVDERVERVKTFLGQSLAGPPGSVSLLRLGESALDWSLRREEGLWQAPEAGRDEARSAAGRSQALALEIGDGRVVVTGEAGLFTEMGLAGAAGVEYDNGQFAINIVHWLAGELN